MVEMERVRFLNDRKTAKGQYVVYWMQASQRAEYNHALEYAIEQANDLRQPLLVFFGITESFPDANLRHYYFMLQGLKETQQKLADRGISTVIQHTEPHKGVLPLAEKASLLVTDRGYLKVQRDWRRYVAGRITCPLIQVESDTVVPVETASQKEEYSAATLRPKINRQIAAYLAPFKEHRLKSGLLDIQIESLDLSDIDKVIADLAIDSSVKSVIGLQGGTTAAKKLLAEFIDTKLQDYASLRNDPSQDCTSRLSPYLHFGQISPLLIVHKTVKNRHPAAQEFLEQLVIRRELAINFVYYNSFYDSFRCLPGWAQQTLSRHTEDRRPYLYSRQELENASTHDRYWNTAQRQMTGTGTMHNYMRMYWGKKILEWSPTPQEAFATSLYLNNKYQMDGRDPNSYAGIAWCFGKHDRPWKERPVFGIIRYMNAQGLERKFEIEKYVQSNL